MIIRSIDTFIIHCEENLSVSDPSARKNEMDKFRRWPWCTIHVSSPLTRLPGRVGRRIVRLVNPLALLLQPEPTTIKQRGNDVLCSTELSTIGSRSLGETAIDVLICSRVYWLWLILRGNAISKSCITVCPGCEDRLSSFASTFTRQDRNSLRMVERNLLSFWTSVARSSFFRQADAFLSNLEKW